jgi:hypothetical protein
VQLRDGDRQADLGGLEQAQPLDEARRHAARVGRERGGREAGNNRNVGLLAPLDRLEDPAGRVGEVEAVQPDDRRRLPLPHLDDEPVRQLAADDHGVDPGVPPDSIGDRVEVERKEQAARPHAGEVEDRLARHAAAFRRDPDVDHGDPEDVESRQPQARGDDGGGEPETSEPAGDQVAAGDPPPVAADDPLPGHCRPRRAPGRAAAHARLP